MTSLLQAAGRPEWTVTADDVVLDRWATAMRAANVSERTIYLRTGTVRRAARHSGSRVTALPIEGLRHYLAAQRAAWTTVTCYSALRAWGKWALAEGLTDVDPTERLAKPATPKGRPRPCSTIALHAIIDAASDEDRPRVLLAAFQGLRAAEVAAVHGRDIDIEAGDLRVKGKGGLEAVIPLHPAIAELAREMPADDWWFPSPNRPGDHIRAAAVTAAVQRACLAAGVPTHGAHRLRHWYGTNLVREGADLRVTQTLMRHSNLSTTAKYVEASDEARRAAVLRLPTGGHTDRSWTNGTSTASSHEDRSMRRTD